MNIKPLNIEDAMEVINRFTTVRVLKDKDNVLIGRAIASINGNEEESLLSDNDYDLDVHDKGIQLPLEGEYSMNLFYVKPVIHVGSCTHGGHSRGTLIYTGSE